jgi:hypothetical protein
MAEHVEIEGFEDFLRISRASLKVATQALLEVKRLRMAVEAIAHPGTGKMTLQFGEPFNSDIVQAASLQTREDLSMPAKETDVQTIPCSEMETDGLGNPVTLNPANVVWAIDDPTIATLTQNADGSATFKAVKPVPPAVNPRIANVSCTDTVTGVKGTDTLEVDNSATDPGKMVLTFGTPA